MLDIYLMLSEDSKLYFGKEKIFGKQFPSEHLRNGKECFETEQNDETGFFQIKLNQNGKERNGAKQNE